jgi:2-dehydro-3-deoxyphosphogluconate aldolase/(4S)-4-hydroxy-2-oxoglutarate aldolase
MAKYSRLETYNTILDKGLVPIFYNPDIEIATQIIKACLDGGAACVEFTNRGDQASIVFAELARRFGDKSGPILGVGSILDAATAAEYIQMGANYIVAPIFNRETALLCNRRKVAYIPGCGSVTEISDAEELGAEICKIFPGTGVGGPGFVKAVLGPMPWARLMPTGGVEASREGVRAWILAGAACIAMGSRLISKDLVEARNFAAITERVKNVLLWVEEARQERAG